MRLDPTLLLLLRERLLLLKFCFPLLGDVPVVAVEGARDFREEPNEDVERGFCVLSTSDVECRFLFAFFLIGFLGFLEVGDVRSSEMSRSNSFVTLSWSSFGGKSAFENFPESLGS